MPASRPSPVEPTAHGPGDEPVGPPAGPVTRPGDHDRSRTVAGTDERAIVRLLASGRLRALHALLAERGRDDLLALVAETDARARSLAMAVPDVQMVLERVEREEAPGSPLRSWCQAILAERLLLDYDGAGLFVARQGLDDLGRHRPPALATHDDL